MRSTRAAVLGAALAACLLAARARAEDGRPFSGTWTLAGTRTVLDAGGARPAAFVHATGSLVMTKGDPLGKGFFGELVAFDDGDGLVVGRAVFTDEVGDKVFASFRADRIGTGRRASGTLTRGTGRWAGVTGEIFLSWKYDIEAGASEFEALAVAVEGLARRAPAKAGPPAEAPK